MSCELDNQSPIISKDQESYVLDCDVLVEQELQNLQRVQENIGEQDCDIYPTRLIDILENIMNASKDYQHQDKKKIRHLICNTKDSKNSMRKFKQTPLLEIVNQQSQSYEDSHHNTLSIQTGQEDIEQIPFSQNNNKINMPKPSYDYSQESYNFINRSQVDNSQKRFEWKNEFVSMTKKVQLQRKISVDTILLKNRQINQRPQADYDIKYRTTRNSPSYCKINMKKNKENTNLEHHKFISLTLSKKNSELFSIKSATLLRKKKIRKGLSIISKENINETSKHKIQTISSKRNKIK